MPRRYSLICWALPLICYQWLLFALFDPEVFGVTQRFANVGFMFGTLYGQTTLAASWAALGPGPLRWRLPLSLVWVASLPVAIAINGCFFSFSDPAEVPLVIGACLFIQWTVVQIPLWALVICFRVRLHHADDPADMQNYRGLQFDIRDLMIITAVVGVIFGVGRIMFSGLSDWGMMSQNMQMLDSFLAPLVVVLPLPLLLAGLLLGRQLPRFTIPAVFLVVTLIGFAKVWELALFEVLLGARAMRTGGFIDFIAINAFTAVTILAGVVVLRLNGYRIDGFGQRTE